ncbi:MAG: YceD family protein [Gammaproteobacteria bacterium]|nr:YceD family protein [Gammaproteobacteria bacterium]
MTPIPLPAYNRGAMQREHLPLTIDPFRSAGRELSYGGALPIRAMERLTTSLVSHEGDVKVQLQLAVDAQGIPYLKGNLEVCLNLQCQRCLESYGHEVSSEFLLGIVRSTEESERLPKHYDPLVIEGETLIISDMIEEELIISLPVVPMHLPSDCSVKLDVFSAESVESDKKENPFQVIESLRVIK